MNEKYIFDPVNYGFEHISKFPELAGLYGQSTYIKVICVSNGAYWYKFCYPCTTLIGDDRWLIGGSSFSKKGNNRSASITDYLGAITSHEYATELLMHVMAAMSNESVHIDGKKRFERNINSERNSTNG